jgi:hypothetical protein
MLKAVAYFKNPLELYVFDQQYADYVAPHGQTANQTQAWAAAAILNAVARVPSTFNSLNDSWSSAPPPVEFIDNQAGE